MVRGDEGLLHAPARRRFPESGGRLAGLAGHRLPLSRRFDRLREGEVPPLVCGPFQVGAEEIRLRAETQGHPPAAGFRAAYQGQHQAHPGQCPGEHPAHPRDRLPPGQSLLQAPRRMEARPVLQPGGSHELGHHVQLPFLRLPLHEGGYRRDIPGRDRCGRPDLQLLQADGPFLHGELLRPVRELDLYALHRPDVQHEDPVHGTVLRGQPPELRDAVQ